MEKWILQRYIQLQIAEIHGNIDVHTYVCILEMFRYAMYASANDQYNLSSHVSFEFLWLVCLRSLANDLCDVIMHFPHRIIEWNSPSWCLFIEYL